MHGFKGNNTAIVNPVTGLFVGLPEIKTSFSLLFQQVLILVSLIFSQSLIGQKIKHFPLLTGLQV